MDRKFVRMIKISNINLNSLKTNISTSRKKERKKKERRNFRPRKLRVAWPKYPNTMVVGVVLFARIVIETANERGFGLLRFRKNFLGLPR